MAEGAAACTGPRRGALTALSSVMAGRDPATQPNAQHAWEDQPVRPGPADQKPKKNTAPMLSNQTGFTVERASTVEADASKLVCEITVSVLNRGRTLTQHGKYTITLYGKKWRSAWEPGY